MRNSLVFTICLGLCFAPDVLAVDVPIKSKVETKAKPETKSKPETKGEKKSRTATEKIVEAAKKQGPKTKKIPTAPIIYNRMPTQAQFKSELVSSEPVSILNGGIGNGTNQSYFCSGMDEADQYNSALFYTNPGWQVKYDWPPNVDTSMNRGTYHLVRLLDHCRMVGGCGDVPADKRFFAIGIPTHATNCYMWGKTKSFDDLIYTNPPDQGAAGTSPLGKNHPAWLNRNFIIDPASASQHAFVYGHYLFKQIDRSAEANPNLNVSANEMAITLNTSQPYDIENSSTPFALDIPYSPDHLKQGFTCAQISRAGGYKSNPLIQPWNQTGECLPTDYGWRLYHQTLLEYEVNFLAAMIANNDFGNLYPSAPGNWESLNLTQKESAAIIVNIWGILNEMLSKVGWVGTPNPDDILIKKCPHLADGALVEYFPDNNTIGILKPIAEDCHSKRARGSNPTYNTENCEPSYGLRYNGGLYEKYSNAGYTLRDGGDSMVADPGAYARADGYSVFVSSLLAHQLVHAYFQKKLNENRMKGWPANPTALQEEELAVMAQAVVFSIHELAWNDGYNRMSSSFNMDWEKFVREVANSDGHVTDVLNSGQRFLYRHSPKGYGGIFLGPFYTNMINIFRNLKDQRPEQARMMALYHALGPTLTPPALMTFNGAERPFEIKAIGSSTP